MGISHILIDVLLGLACGGGFALALRRGSMLAGLAAVIITFLLASGMFLAVRLLARDRIIGFGLASVLAFLATVVAAVLGRKP